mmetsp:Transcript_13732/g.27853  ORF Transcript_13732/g.27853 Transcript_13732/m.27853 type:complete len:280 (+) Transcript_13732:422-1261(+)
MNTQNTFPTSFIRQIHLDYPIESAGSDQCWIEHVLPVGGAQNTNIVVRRITIQPIHAGQQCIQRLLGFIAATAATGISPFLTKRINFVNEYDAGTIELLRLGKQLAHASCSRPGVLLYKVRSRAMQQRNVGHGRRSAGEGGFTYHMEGATYNASNKWRICEIHIRKTCIRNSFYGSVHERKKHKCIRDMAGINAQYQYIPVPGGPSSRRPVGGRAPTREYLSGFRRVSTSSITSCLALSMPSISSNVVAFFASFWFFFREKVPGPPPDDPAGADMPPFL